MYLSTQILWVLKLMLWGPVVCVHVFLSSSNKPRWADSCLSAVFTGWLSYCFRYTGNIKMMFPSLGFFVFAFHSTTHFVNVYSEQGMAMCNSYFPLKSLSTPINTMFTYLQQPTHQEIQTHHLLFSALLTSTLHNKKS